MELLSRGVAALVLCGAALCILIYRKKNLFDSFLDGAREGLETSIRLIPVLVGLIMAVSMLNASGFPEVLGDALKPVLSRLGIPVETVPLILTRPMSGSASTAALNGIFAVWGADSLAGLCGSVLVGSSDTVIYIASVYFGAVGIRKTRYALWAAFLTMLFAVFFSCFVVRLLHMGV